MVVGLDAVEHILQIAEVKVEFAVVSYSTGNPSSTEPCIRLRYNRGTAIPNTGVMGQIIAHYHGTLHPTFKDDVLGEVELSSDAFLDGVVLEVAEQL